MKRFQIKTRISDKYFWVYVYDDIKKLRNDATKHDKRAGKTDYDHSDVLGLVHPYERIRISGEKEFVHNNIGIIRLCKKYAGSEIVSHEIVHAAMWQYRLEYGTEEYDGSVENANFGNCNSEQEETFARIYGQLFRSITTKMYKHNIWI